MAKVSKRLLDLCAGNVIQRKTAATTDTNQQDVFICDKAQNKITREYNKEAKRNVRRK